MFLKNLPLTVKRQKIIGQYILDFYIASHKLAIELDGSQHYDPEEMAYDKNRESYLKELGIRTVRYTNLDIQKRFDAVCEDILDMLDLDI